MKKILYIIPTVLLALSACTLEKEQAVSTVNYPEGMVCVSVDVMYPDLTIGTRAMDQVPTINKLYVAVFGSEGSFQNFIPAEFESLVNYQDHNTTAKYKVYLPITDKKRHLHFIANPPEDEHGEVILPVFGDEDEVINAMVKTKPDDAYWQKVEMDKIGALYPNPTIQDVYFEPDTYTAGKLAKICLVRNYAKIVVSVGANEPYELLDYRLMNVPNTGTVAPWNTGTRQYEPRYMNIYEFAEANNPGDFYESLMTSYLGFMADATDLDLTPQAPVNDLTDPEHGAYMYERTTFTRVSPENSQTCFIAHVKFTEDTQIKDGVTILAGKEYYYKIAIVGPNSEYIPILRNIQYSIEITGINELGKETVDEAAAGDFAGNVSTGLAISSLNELANNQSMIRVNQTEYTSNGLKQIDLDSDGVPDKVPDYTIYWQFFPDTPNSSGTPITTLGTTGSNDVSVSMYDITPESAINGSLDDLIASAGEAILSTGTWGTITVPIAERGNTTKTSVIRISGRKGTGQRLYREVIINVIPVTEFLNQQPQSTDATIQGTYIEADTADGLGKEVKVHFRIPAELGASMFPLNVTIEVKKNNLYATSKDLPVSTGPSYWDAAQSTFYIIRQIPLSEYRTIVNGEYVYKQDYVCTLYTSKEENNSTQIVLQDEKGFFKPCVRTLTTATFYADQYEFNAKGMDTSVTMNVTSTIDWDIMDLSSGLSADPMSFTADDAGMVTTAVVFSFDPNTTAGNKIYTARLVGTVDGQSVSKDITITQVPRVLRTASKTVTFNPGDFSTTNRSIEKDAITVSFSRIDAASSTYLTVNANESSTVTITPTSSDAEMNVTITNIQIAFQRANNNNYNPSSVSGSFSGGTGNANNNTALTATYNGNATINAVSTTLTARTTSWTDWFPRDTRITGVTVTYSYQYYE